MGYFNSVPDENYFIDVVCKFIVDLIVVIMLAVIFIYCFCSPVKDTGKSMESTIYNSQYVLINKIKYKIKTPQKYDIIAFKDSNNKINLKRIYGMPGDKIIIKDSCLYVNGIKDDKMKEQIISAGICDKEITVPDDEYFVLGDNVNYSEDSRSKAFGMVVKKNIIGSIWLRISPLSKIGFIS